MYNFSSMKLMEVEKHLNPSNDEQEYMIIEHSIDLIQ